MYQDEGYDPNNEKHVEIAEKLAVDRRERALSDVREILALPSGRRLFWKYLTECGIFKSSFTGNNTTFFNEGKREVGLRLLNDMTEAVPEAFLLMQQEEAKRDANEKNKLIKEIKDVRTS